MDLATWERTYLDLGREWRPPKRFRVNYRRLATHLKPLGIGAGREAILDRLGTFKAEDPVFWAGLLAKMQTIPADADWFVVMKVLCGWLARENPLFVEHTMMEWLLEGI